MSKLALLAAILAGAAFCAAGCGVPAIHRAARDNNPREILRLAEAGVDLNAYNDPVDRWTAVEMAAHNGHKDALLALLASGARPELGRHRADIALRHPELVKLIEDRAASGKNPAAAPRTQPGNLDDAGYDRLRAAAGMAPEKRALVSDVDNPSKKAAERPDDFALVIGVEEYQSLPKADYGVRDAQTVRKHLEAQGFPARNIISLEGSQATGNKLKSYLEEWLPLNVKPTSTLFVYYSGHGAPDPQTGDAYLVPWDGDATFLKSTAYPLKKFYADLGKTKAKRVLVALDACFSGAGGRSVLAQGARPLVAKVADVPVGERVTVLAAASGEEITGSLNEQGHGMFTYFLLKGLAEGKKTARELHEYLSPKVQDEARRQNRQQSPALIGEDAPF